MLQLRYFYEEFPELHIIAAGSLLEIKIEKEGFSFPVGRVEYCYMYPVSFDEYLNAGNEDIILEHINSFDLYFKQSDEIHQMLMKKFKEYTMIGGMPEVINIYLESQSLFDTHKIFESILTSYKEDVYKYNTKAKAVYIQHVIEHSPYYISNIIKYEKFGESGFRSREIKEAFDILEKAMLIKRIYPSASIKSPIITNYKKSPKLLFLDMGMVNYINNLTESIFNNKDLNSVYQGYFSEQIVGQSLLTLKLSKQQNLNYWYRDKPGSIAEVDFIIPFNNQIIPIEVKSGKTGTLKSLHQFMNITNGNIAVRIYSGNFYIQDINLQGIKKYKLISIPFYFLFKLYDILKYYF